MEDITEELKNIIINVNETLSYYDPGWSRIQRSPISSREEIETFSQYIECRFNLETFRSPILREFAEYFDGYLFEVTGIINAEEKKYRFKEVCIELTKSWENFSDPNILDEDDEELRRHRFWEVTDEVKALLGGDKIYFNHSAKKPKIRIE